MAACENPHNILDKTLPEIPTTTELLGSLSPPPSSSWNHINAAVQKSLQKSSFADIFGEFLLKDESFSSSSSSSSAFSSSTPSLYFGSSSSSSSSSAYATDTEAEVETFNNDETEEAEKTEETGESEDEIMRDEERQLRVSRRYLYEENRRCCCCCSEWKRSKITRAVFPPPISCIGRSGKPWVLFKSYREKGRFILKEIRIPTQEFMHACRKDGRLKLHIIQSDEEIPDEDDYEEDEDVEEGEVEEDAENYIKEY